MLFLLLTGGIAAYLSVLVDGAKITHPDPKNMDPERPLNRIAAMFLAGIALVMLVLFFMVFEGPLFALPLSLLAVSARTTGRFLKFLTPLYPYQFLLAIAGIVNVGMLWLSALLTLTGGPNG